MNSSLMHESEEGDTAWKTDLIKCYFHPYLTNIITSI